MAKKTFYYSGKIELREGQLINTPMGQGMIHKINGNKIIVTLTTVKEDKNGKLYNQVILEPVPSVSFNVLKII